MRFEVPQFIEIEDKIFGPFTWKQFVYLAGGVGIAVVIFITMPLFVFILFGLPIGGLAFALAFYPVNNRPFSVFLESMFSFYGNSREYHWKRETDIVYKEELLPPQTKVSATGKLETSSRDINSLSRKLELNALQKDI